MSKQVNREAAVTRYRADPESSFPFIFRHRFELLRDSLVWRFKKKALDHDRRQDCLGGPQPAEVHLRPRLNWQSEVFRQRGDNDDGRLKSV
jgi:hypothetical protein